MDFSPEIYQHSAGLTLYYDNMNHLFCIKPGMRPPVQRSWPSFIWITASVTTTRRKSALRREKFIWRWRLTAGKIQCSWSVNGEKYQNIGAVYDTSRSDEYSGYGEFTGAFVGMACVDSMLHRKEALFDSLFSYRAVEDAMIE